MYTFTGFLNRDETDLEDMTQEIRINSCGIYKLIARERVSTYRPGGRGDYQILYVAEGKAWFTVGDDQVEAAAGNMFLYRPGEDQKYDYYLKDKPEVYWVHFTGWQAEELLEQAGFQGGALLHSGISKEYEELFLHMIQELQVSRPCYDQLLPLYLKQLLVLVNRRLREGGKERSRMQREMEEAVKYFNENFSGNIEIEAYAESQHMSNCWFIRSFKQYMGMPPLQYITSIRMNRARELLESTDMTISEISEIVGYDNPLYFSRIFKNVNGVSPRGYRRSC